MTDQPEPMETMSQAMVRLHAAGYVEHWIAGDGKLHCRTCSDAFEPAEVTVGEIVRFEGPSDPGDEAILFALDGPCGHRGQFSAAYGPNASIAETELIAALGHAAS